MLVIDQLEELFGYESISDDDRERFMGVIDAFAEAGIRDKVKFMVGGAPLTDQFAQEIGADGYAPDAASAADKFKEFITA